MAKEIILPCVEIMTTVTGLGKMKENHQILRLEGLSKFNLEQLSFSNP